MAHIFHDTLDELDNLGDEISVAQRGGGRGGWSHDHELLIIDVGELLDGGEIEFELHRVEKMAEGDGEEQRSKWVTPAHTASLLGHDEGGLVHIIIMNVITNVVVVSVVGDGGGRG